jgi:predicted MFS family arabinose efflux permease
VSQASLTTATAPAVALPGPGLRGSPRLALLAAALGVSMVALDSTIGAMLQPSALALLRDTFPPRRLNTAIGAWGAAIGVSMAAGPVAGGLLVQHAGWEACFYVNIPVALIALTTGLLVLRETPAAAARFFDLPGMALLSGALFLLIWALIQGAASRWGSAATIGFLAAAACAGGLFTVRETRAREPLLPLRLLRSASLPAAAALVVMLMFALFGAMFFIAFYLENVHGLSPVATGVRLLPLTGMLIVGSPLSGVLIGRRGPRVPLVGGALLATVALLGLSRLGATSGLGGTAGWFALLGLGLSPVAAGAADVIVGRAPAGLTGVAAGLQATAMQVGGTLGTSVLGAVMSARVAALLRPAGSPRTCRRSPPRSWPGPAEPSRSAARPSGTARPRRSRAPSSASVTPHSSAACTRCSWSQRRPPSPAPWPACSPSGELQGAPPAARRSCFVNEY